jgi:hypothetical protein
MKSMRKANRALIGGSMALNTLPLMQSGANAGTAMNALQGGIGIGVTGLVSDKMFDLMENKKRRRINCR